MKTKTKSLRKILFKNHELMTYRNRHPEINLWTDQVFLFTLINLKIDAIMTMILGLAHL